MPRITLLLLLVPGILAASPAWESTELISEFHAEGAAVADYDGDGHVDVAYGPFWFAGPDFETKTRLAEGGAFDAGRGYSESFLSYSVDANDDGRRDILVIGFPGKEARLYLNPSAEAGVDATWPMHAVAPVVDHESPFFVDFVPGGLPEIVCSRDGAYGYYEAGEDPTAPWTWHAVSESGAASGRFEHGMGVGDVNGDGRLDIVQREFWLENRGDSIPWPKHRWTLPPQPGGAQILVHDVDGDGDNDLISSLKAHGFGLAWFEQTEPGRFAAHPIMGESSTDNPHGVCFSQLHALALADIDGDGRQDFVTGKRYFAHNGRDPGGLQEPVLYWFRNTVRDGEIEFVPHHVHSDSGVGVEVDVTDLNADGAPDIVTSSKKGLIIHLQDPDAEHVAPERWKVAGGRPQDDYGRGLDASESLARIEAPEGFSVDLIASEPEMTQPIAMTFDARGRIWVIEGRTYPQRAAEGEGKDRILIFEDSDANGAFETRKVFAENINLASGIEIGFGGVYVGAAPYLLFFPDRDGDDRPDGEPEVLLDGWGWEDTHETLNSFTWGPDGWLYGCHGVFTHSRVGKPGTPDEEREPINAGVWRFHPVTHEFEVYAHGTSNPWGVEFNEYGDWFISACVIPHFYHLSQGGRYQRQAGQHFDPYTFDDIKTIADHAHYAGNLRDHAFWGENYDTRPAAPADTSALGGGHAHCGLLRYDAPEFPAEYRGEFFFHNLHGHRMVRETVERDGSGYVARHRPDFLLTNNHDFIGVGAMQGPDGAIYFSDWVDPQTCHHIDIEIWDRTNGRIFRVRHGDAKSTVTDLLDLNDAELVATLGHENSFHARQARRLLQERAADDRLDKEAFGEAIARFESDHADDVPMRLRAFWTRHVTGHLSEELVLDALSDPEEHIRGWAVQLAAVDDRTLPRFIKMAEEEDSLVVRRRLASKLQRLPLEDRWELAEKLISHWRGGWDRNIPWLAWYGISPLVEADPERALELSRRTSWSELKDFITRRAAVFPEGRSAVTRLLSEADKADEFVERSRQLLIALSSLPPVDRPGGWEDAKAKGRSFDDHDQIDEILSRLGARFGDPDSLERWRDLARNGDASAAERKEALELLTIGRDEELGAIARELLDLPGLQVTAIAALRQAPGEETARAVVKVLPEMSLELRNDAINLLGARPEMALVLLEAVDAGALESSLISPVMLDQFERFDHPEIQSLVQENWVRGGAEIDLEQLAAAIDEWKERLRPKVLAKADASRGRQVYAMTCGTCHPLFGEGVALGPDLTGSNRADLHYLLENVLAPSAVVGKEYMLQIFQMKDGSTLSGMVRAETPEFITLAMPGGAEIDVRKAEVESREKVAQSLMPAGLFDALPRERVADLVKYLRSPEQVPLPEASD